MKKIVFLGDSITAGFHELKQFPNVVNLGKSGDRTIDVIERLAEVKAINPDTVFLLIGANDILTNQGIYFASQKINLEATYEFIVHYLSKQLNRPKLYLISILPMAGLGLVSRQVEGVLNQTVDQFNEYIAQVAKQYQAVYLDLNSMYKMNGRMNYAYTTDGLHLNQAGYHLFLEKIKNLLN